MKTKKKKAQHGLPYIQWRNRVHALIGDKPPYKFMKAQYSRGVTPEQLYQALLIENEKHEYEN